MFPAKGLLASLVAGIGLYCFAGTSLGVAALTSLVLFLSLGGLRYCRLIKLIPRDMALVLYISKILKLLGKLEKEGTQAADLFLRQAKLYPRKAAVVFEGKQWTFAELDAYACRVANYFGGTVGLKKGDVVALFVENSPEFIGVFLGLAKIGVVSAFLNTNIRKESLSHCAKAVKTRAIVYSSSLEDSIVDALPTLEEPLKREGGMFSVRGNARSIEFSRNLDEELDGVSDSPPPPVQNPSLRDCLCYIYTSGTTGLPKAVILDNNKYLRHSFGVIVSFGVTSDDIVYCALPLYHTNGGNLALGALLFNGCTLVVRKKFSASHFWDDCIEWKCTIFFYIGEVCRYLLTQPHLPKDTQHSIRQAIGNGLRPQIWKQVQNRFKIKKICEFYGSTEGNVAFGNFTNKEGSVGFIPFSLPLPRKSFIVKVDSVTGEVYHGSNGYCVNVDVNEPGELLGKIEDNKLLRFDGYSDKAATDKKILRNVFKPGDKYFLTGDLMRHDAEGYVYFCDRLGDTFRWKGENVSTSEVEGIIASILKLRDVTVYGVSVPGTDGRAGAAAIVDPEKTVNLADFLKEVSDCLPKYAIPVFIRLVNEVELTGTFKLQKTRLKREGIDLKQVGDPMFILDPREKGYVPFDETKYEELLNGGIKL